MNFSLSQGAKFLFLPLVHCFLTFQQLVFKYSALSSSPAFCHCIFIHPQSPAAASSPAFAFSLLPWDAGVCCSRTKALPNVPRELPSLDSAPHYASLPILKVDWHTFTNVCAGVQYSCSFNIDDQSHSSSSELQLKVSKRWGSQRML